MAIKKKIINEVGIETNYHRIYEFNYKKDIKQVKLVVKSYVNEEYREEEKELDQIRFIEKKEYFFKNQEDNLSLTDSYTLLKTLDEFKDAEDLLENEVIDDGTINQPDTPNSDINNE